MIGKSPPVDSANETVKILLNDPVKYCGYTFYSLVYQLCVIQEVIQSKPILEIISVLENLDQLLSVHEFTVESKEDYWIGNDDGNGTLIQLAYTLVESILSIADGRLNPKPLESQIDSPPADSETEKQSPGKRPNFPKWVHEILVDWLRGHLDHPYPTDEEKKVLMAQTNLTLSQLNNYFINARRRVVPKLIDGTF
jgi:hypothetical protein